jgi:hypothetical protein
MKLIINRSQQAVTGMLGGHKGMSFTLRYRLDLTPDEQDLVNEYRLMEYPLTWRTIRGDRLPDDTVGGMVSGRSQTLDDVKTLLQNEEIIKAACDALATLFDVVRTFGGDEVIEYPRQ